MTGVQDFFTFFFINSASAGALAWNCRAVSKVWITNILISDAVYAAIGFVLISRVAAANSTPAIAGYIMGAMVGSVAAAWLTKKFSGE